MQKAFTSFRNKASINDIYLEMEDMEGMSMKKWRDKTGHGGGHIAKRTQNHCKRSCQLDWKCKMFSGVALSGFIIGVLSYDHYDNVTCA